MVLFATLPLGEGEGDGEGVGDDDPASETNLTGVGDGSGGETIFATPDKNGFGPLAGAGVADVVFVCAETRVTAANQIALRKIRFTSW